MEWKLLLSRPWKRQALNPTCRQERSIHNPSLEGRQKDELQREGRETQTHWKVGGEDGLNQKFNQNLKIHPAKLAPQLGPNVLGSECRVREVANFMESQRRARRLRKCQKAVDLVQPDAVRCVERLTMAFALHFPAFECLRSTRSLASFLCNFSGIRTKKWLLVLADVPCTGNSSKKSFFPCSATLAEESYDV